MSVVPPPPRRSLPTRPCWRPTSTASLSASLIFFFIVITAGGFYAAKWRRPQSMESLDEWGLGGRGFGTLDHLVPARRRPLHGVHVRRRTGRDVRDRRGQRLLRRAVHDRGLPADLHLHAAAVVGRAPPRLRHAGRLRPWPLRLARPVAGGRGHRHPRDDALHRAAAGRHPGGARDDRARSAATRLVARTCRCSSPSRCSRPTPTPPACGRRR